MEKLKTRNEYVGCNRKCRFYADDIRATSYDHWTFVRVINGKVIFNNYDYSPTTSRHQDAVRTLMRNLGIKIDAYVYMSSSLNEYTFKNTALTAFYNTICKYIVQNHTPRVRKKTKDVNDKLIKEYKQDIKLLREIGAEYSMKDILRLYKKHKKTRDDKETFLKEVKQYKNKIVMNDYKETYRVANYDIQKQRLVLEPVKRRNKDGMYVRNKYIHWTWFKKEFKLNKLLNAVNA